MSALEADEKLMDARCELALLGCLVRAQAETRVQIVMTVREEWFTSAERQVVYRVLHGLVNECLAIDLNLLHEGLRGKLEPDVARRVVEALGAASPDAGLWRSFADRVQGYHTRRQGLAACRAALAQFADLSVPANEALEQAEAALFALHSQRMGAGMRPIADSLRAALASIEESWQNRGHVTGGLACGFTDLDRSNIKGMRPGHVWIVAAPPGGGKTVFMMKLAWNIATGTGDYREFDPERHPPQKVGIFTLEMDDVQLTERLLITQSRIVMNKMQRGQVSRAELEQLRSAGARLAKSNLHFEFCPGVSIQELRVKARYAVMRYGLKLLCIDYAQLITSTSKEARGNRTQEMMDVSKGLKLLAHECGVPVVVLAQPKQETWGLRAQLNALGETSQLAKDADLVGMLGFWDKLKPADRGEQEEDSKASGGGRPWDEDEADAGPADDPSAHAYLDIVKNRHGPNTVGKRPIKLKWERDFFDFLSTNERLYDPSGKTYG